MSQAQPTILALDAHGGDFGPPVTVAAAVDAVAADPGLTIHLVGLPEQLEEQIAVCVAEAGTEHRERLQLVPADKVIAGDARPVAVLRKGEGSSLWNAMRELAEGRAHACVSAGNTVAMMTLGVKLVGTLAGIRRPALMSQIPSSRGMTSMLDLGANLNVDADQLFQFALMGAVACASDTGKPPSIGLLNVGHEDSKGHSVVREAHERLKGSGLDYRGFIEGHDIFAGKVDVAVCDGFAGNLILKSSEGLAGMLFGELKRTLGSSFRARLGGWLARPALTTMLERLDPAKHNGAPLLGLRGVVVKSHGGAGRFALFQALLEASREVQRNVPERIEKMIRSHQAEAES